MIIGYQSTKPLLSTISDERQIELEQFLMSIKLEYPDLDQLAFICIGTDRSTGDAFGPLVGTMLSHIGFKHVYGTLDNPCDADYVERIIEKLNHSNKIVIAIDACLGNDASIGSFICTNQPLIPGAAVGRKLPPVGHYSIAAVVNKKGLKSYWQLQHTSLYYVYRMVYTLQKAFQTVWKEGIEHEINNG